MANSARLPALAGADIDLETLITDSEQLLHERELVPLPTDSHDTGENPVADEEHASIRKLLYLSHLLSAWNSRVFEFGAFLFLANIYPQTLLPASVYALARSASAALLSPLLGSYIDRTNRLRVIRLSIVGQRLPVALSCLIFFLMMHFPSLREDLFYSRCLLTACTVLACTEKLSSVLNTISMERDWVVTVASGHEERLRLLNSQMRRIDLFCKLVGPLTVALVDGTSPGIAVAGVGAMTALSVSVEYICVAKVYRQVLPLQAARTATNTPSQGSSSLYASIQQILRGAYQYIRHSAFLPSFALALLYLTVLSFAGQMITYLLALGISSSAVGVLRGVSAVFELSATWIAPKFMKHLGPVRAGIYFINWQIFCVSVACAFFWLDFSPKTAAIGTICAVIASRLGLWGFDLSAQIIVQEEVEADFRGTFSAQEFALQNVFEMLAFASTIVFPKPSQFRYPAMLSAIAVGLAGVLYALFVRARRGHLLHLSNCMDPHGKRKDHQHWWMISSSRRNRGMNFEYEMLEQGVDR